jgi:peptide/nickel transport system substrate-binding protein
VTALKSTPGVTLSLFPSTETTYLGFNENVKPFQDVHVRRAISYAIDRSALVKAVLFGNGQAANSIFPPQVPYYDASSGGLQLDTAQAKAELAKSSVPHGFTTTLQVPSGNSDWSTDATIIQSELKPLGINVQIQQVDANVAHNNVQAEKYEMAFSLWTMDIPDPDELATFALDPNAGSKSFFTSYNNPAVVKAVHAAELTTVPSARQTDYNSAQTQSAQDAFLAFLYYSPYQYLESSNVHGFNVTPLGNYHMEDVWLSSS